MTKKWILWRALATLILVGLLIAGGVGVYYAGWSQGYGAGQLAGDGGEESATPPYPTRNLGRPLAFVPFMFGAGLLLKIVLGLVLLGVIFRLIRFVIWGAAFRPTMAGPWAGHWHPAYGRRAARWYRQRWMHAPMPPWHWGRDEPSEDEAEPETDTGENEA